MISFCSSHTFSKSHDLSFFDENIHTENESLIYLSMFSSFQWGMFPCLPWFIRFYFLLLFGESVALSCKVPFQVLHRIKVILKPSPLYLRWFSHSTLTSYLCIPFYGLPPNILQRFIFTVFMIQSYNFFMLFPLYVIPEDPVRISAPHIHYFQVYWASQYSRL